MLLEEINTGIQVNKTEAQARKSIHNGTHKRIILVPKVEEVVIEETIEKIAPEIEVKKTPKSKK